MTVTSSVPRVGDLLRDWRQRRRISQLDLALEAEVSARHLSFVETGRSRPSRELVLHLAEHLDVPLRERNSLLLAAGYAPSYRARSLDTDELEPVRQAIDKILKGHEPFPAVVVDRGWNVVSANSALLSLLGAAVSPGLLEPPANALRIALHPDGLAPHIENFTEYADHLLARLDRQASMIGSDELRELARELRSYPGVPGGSVNHENASERLFAPLVLRLQPGPRLTFFSTIATFGTALDVTVAELAIEQFFPADAATAAALTS
ncbi:MAG TPA: helix-turn-helix transcriptional regulator [Acidimicrobiales bacterium]|jgi:transcriptional regulator with XRE-family HTH domain|nr:helix-turn-helix transcriptional regulator [Acidimicrobiales bacterium]